MNVTEGYKLSILAFGMMERYNISYSNFHNLHVSQMKNESNKEQVFNCLSIFLQFRHLKAIRKNGM